MVMMVAASPGRFLEVVELGRAACVNPWLNNPDRAKVCRKRTAAGTNRLVDGLSEMTHTAGMSSIFHVLAADVDDDGAQFRYYFRTRDTGPVPPRLVQMQVLVVG